MPNQYSRSELELISDELEAFVRNGFLKKEALSFYEDWLSGESENNFFATHCSLQKIALLPVIEKGLMVFIESAEKKGVHLYLKAPTDELYCTADETILRLLFFRLFEKLLEEALSDTTIEIYLSEGNENCLVEVVLQNKKQTHIQRDDYFKKHRITPANDTDPSEKSFSVFSKLMDDIDGDLQYQFNREGPDYFRLKLPL
jgi:hypothetical protein